MELLEKPTVKMCNIGKYVMLGENGEEIVIEKLVVFTLEFKKEDPFTFYLTITN